MSDPSLLPPAAAWSGSASARRLVAGICLLLLGYAGAAWQGWPQAATARLTAAEAPADGTVSEAAQPSPETATPDHRPPLWTIAPFAILLAAIAVLPLAGRAAHWWESNANKALVALGLGLATLAYYLFMHPSAVSAGWPVAAPALPAASGPNLALAGAVLADAVLHQYLPFVVLLLSLYTIAGGIRIEGDLKAHPSTNAAILAAGAALANVIGTTGAAMLLVRLLLETNSERRHVRHTVVFFIFTVCNCGGLLTPLGDPPLFLGYLRGVPFAWTIRLWPAWLLVNGLIVAVYYLIDRLWFYPREAPADILRDETRVRPLRTRGLGLGLPLLAGVVASIALLDPAKTFPGTDWRPWVYLREAVQLGLVAVSLACGDRAVRQANQFNFAAIVEVGVLFAGIFLCMQPPLQILHVEGPRLGLHRPEHFFWASGALSSFLDNAPTYLVFFETARSLGEGTVAGVQEPLLVGVSLGAVCLGAMTYIGNGPNFMVKTIAEQSGVRMPSFFGYMLWSCAVLLPIFALVSRWFL